MLVKATIMNARSHAQACTLAGLGILSGKRNPIEKGLHTAHADHAGRATQRSLVRRQQLDWAFKHYNQFLEHVMVMDDVIDLE